MKDWSRLAALTFALVACLGSNALGQEASLEHHRTRIEACWEERTARAGGVTLVYDRLSTDRISPADFIVAPAESNPRVETDAAGRLINPTVEYRSVCTYCVQGARFKYTNRGKRLGEGGALKSTDYTVAFDGVVGASLHNEEGREYPAGFISQERDPSHLRLLSSLVARLSSGLLEDTESCLDLSCLELVDKDARLGEHRCLVVRDSTPGKQYWLCPDFGYLPMRYESKDSAGRVSSRIDFRYRGLDTEAPIPFEVRAVRPDGKGGFRTSEVYTLKSCKTGEAYDARHFQIAFPAGTLLADFRAAEIAKRGYGGDTLYAICRAGGERRYITPAELGVPYARLLETDTGEAVTPAANPSDADSVPSS